MEVELHTHAKLNPEMMALYLDDKCPFGLNEPHMHFVPSHEPVCFFGCINGKIVVKDDCIGCGLGKMETLLDSLDIANGVE